jgi:hypothetical protein
VEDAGRYATQGDKKRGSVVSLAISSTEPGSAVSGAIDCARAEFAAPMMPAMQKSSEYFRRPPLRAGRSFGEGGRSLSIYTIV